MSLTETFREYVSHQSKLEHAQVLAVLAEQTLSTMLASKAVASTPAEEQLSVEGQMQGQMQAALGGLAGLDRLSKGLLQAFCAHAVKVRRLLSHFSQILTVTRMCIVHRCLPACIHCFAVMALHTELAYANKDYTLYCMSF